MGLAFKRPSCRPRQRITHNNQTPTPFVPHQLFSSPAWARYTWRCAYYTHLPCPTPREKLHKIVHWSTVNPRKYLLFLKSAHARRNETKSFPETKQNNHQENELWYCGIEHMTRRKSYQDPLTQKIGTPVSEKTINHILPYSWLCRPYGNFSCYCSPATTAPTVPKLEFSLKCDCGPNRVRRSCGGERGAHTTLNQQRKTLYRAHSTFSRTDCQHYPKAEETVKKNRVHTKGTEAIAYRIDKRDGSTNVHKAPRPRWWYVVTHGKKTAGRQRAWAKCSGKNITYHKIFVWNTRK